MAALVHENFMVLFNQPWIAHPHTCHVGRLTSLLINPGLSDEAKSVDAKESAF